MSNLKISGLTELSSQPADNDLIPIVDSNDTTDAATGTTKKIQASNLIKNASATEKGVVELATQAEYDAGTATGDTGASLMSSPATTRGKKYNDYAADAGATDAYAITITPAITAYATGQVFTFKANTANTGACTLAVSGLSAINIKKNVSTELETGDIVANQIVTVVYDGTNMQMVTRSGSATSTAYVYTASDTWTKPSGITFVEVTCIGAGGGGGGGNGKAAGNLRTGAGGGGGGAYARKIFRASDLDSNVSVTVGAGGTAGTGGSATSGVSGGSGGASSFGTHLSAYGGGGGFRGTDGVANNCTGGSGGGTGGVGAIGTQETDVLGGLPAKTTATAGVGGEGAGVRASENVGLCAEYGGGAGGGGGDEAAGTGGSSLYGGGGGGGSGFISVGNVASGSAAGGAHNSYVTGGGGAAGTHGASSTAGTAGTSRSGYGCGNGGGGGGSDTDSTGSAGGAGGAPGGGGGAGGAGTSVGGAGGAGGVGEVRIFCY